jgi:aminobenzoyl-glutamate utilization protein B
MTETELEVQLIDAIYNIIPSRTLAELVVKNMREVGAPEYTKKELEFASKIAAQFPKQQKIDALRKSKVPGYERFIDVDLPTEVVDPWGEGETSPGSSDVGDVSWITPTTEFGTACNPLGAPGHSWTFVACAGSTIGHKSLVFAAKTMAGAAADLLTDPALRKKARDEHADRLKGRTYRTPLPEGLQPPLAIAKENWEKTPKQ